ncbi:replication initiator [Streptomyces sp. NPDC059496]|uniref:replication initiator n=1 Tax=Streptomyces sp. NPDC059496 TaxID=3346851 RepID=UPI0036B5AA24
MIRLDGPAGPYTPPPAWATPELRAEAIRIATTRAHIDGPEVNGRARSFVFDEQIDTRVVRWPPPSSRMPAPTAKAPLSRADFPEGQYRHYATIPPPRVRPPRLPTRLQT